MEDYEVLRKVWEGGIPIEFRIDKEDLVSKTEVSYFVGRFITILVYLI